jgi:hypothetical protein
MVVKKSQQLTKLSTANLVTLNTSDSGLVKTGQYIADNVIALRGQPLAPSAVAKTLKIPERKARTKMLIVNRNNLDKMIAEFKKLGPGAPRMQNLRADAPIKDVIEAYEWYLEKCVRMSGRWNRYAETCSKQLKKLRRQRTNGQTTPSAAQVDALRARWRQHNAG